MYQDFPFCQTNSTITRYRTLRLGAPAIFQILHSKTARRLINSGNLPIKKPDAVWIYARSNFRMEENFPDFLALRVLRFDCDTLGRSRRFVGGRKRGIRLACTTMGLPYPPTLVDITKLWNVLLATYYERRYRRYRRYRNEGRGYYQYEYRGYGQLD